MKIAIEIPEYCNECTYCIDLGGTKYDCEIFDTKLSLTNNGMNIARCQKCHESEVESEK